ncbi:MAG: hypothetical protein LBB38_00395 [Puniceicoccales bacterium]|jgi:hypothetical protein|nr:hypothetical protein [Puniceicoccales bacterium]
MAVGQYGALRGNPPGSFEADLEEQRAMTTATHALKIYLAVGVAFAIVAGAFIAPLATVFGGMVAVGVLSYGLIISALISSSSVGLVAVFTLLGEIALIGVAVAAVGGITLLLMWIYQRIVYGSLPDTEKYSKFRAQLAELVAKRIPRGMTLRQYLGDEDFERLVQFIERRIEESKARLKEIIDANEAEIETLTIQIAETERLSATVKASLIADDTKTSTVERLESAITRLNTDIETRAAAINQARERLAAENTIYFGDKPLVIKTDGDLNACNFSWVLVEIYADMVVCHTVDRELLSFVYTIFGILSINPNDAIGIKLSSDFELLRERNARQKEADIGNAEASLVEDEL